MSSSQEFFKLIEEIDAVSSSSYAEELKIEESFGTFNKLRKTQLALNEETRSIILSRYGIQGVQLDNIEQVFNPAFSGIGSML